MTFRYVSGAELPNAGWWAFNGVDLIPGLGAGHTFELKIFPAGGGPLLTKTSGLTGQDGSGNGRSELDIPNVVIVWAPGDLSLDPGIYRMQLRIIRDADGH